MLVGAYKQSEGKVALNQGQMLAPMLARGKNELHHNQHKNPHLFDLSCLRGRGVAVLSATQ